MGHKISSIRTVEYSVQRSPAQLVENMGGNTMLILLETCTCPKNKMYLPKKKYIFVKCAHQESSLKSGETRLILLQTCPCLFHHPLPPPKFAHPSLKFKFEFKCVSSINPLPPPKFAHPSLKFKFEFKCVSSINPPPLP